MIIEFCLEVNVFLGKQALHKNPEISSLVAHFHVIVPLPPSRDLQTDTTIDKNKLK